MQGTSKQTLGMIGAALLVVVCVFAMVMGLRYISLWNFPGRGLSVVYEFTGRMRRSTYAAVSAWSGNEPSALPVSEVIKLRASLASLNDVAEENEFLRSISDLPALQERRAVTGGVFAYTVTGADVETIINRGARDGVIEGSTVVTQAGVFMGIVDRVSERSSAVRVLGDPNVQVTGRIAGSEIGGLVRADQTGRVIFDLIGKDESVTEGSLVVTSGLDHVPAGLIIGSVRSVDPDSVTLFQTIHVNIAHEAEPIWRIIILIP